VFQFQQSSEHPEGPVKIAAVERGQLPAPTVVDNDHSADFRSLDHGFHFAAILIAQFCAFDQKDFNGSLIVGVAGFDKRVVAEDRPNAVFHVSASKQLRSNRLGKQNS